jgi:hypothetical protein
VTKSSTVSAAWLETDEGPKHVVLLTSGTPTLRDVTGPIQQLGSMAAAARVHLHAVQVWLAPTLFSSDVRGPARSSNENDSLDYILAGMTGGMAITTHAGAGAFTRLERMLSASYVLGIEALAATTMGNRTRSA